MVCREGLTHACFDGEGWKTAVQKVVGSVRWRVTWIPSFLVPRWAHKAHFSSLMGFQVFLGL